MEGEGFLYLCSCHCIIAIDMKKMMSGGFQTVLTRPPDFTRLPVDKVIVFEEENLPCEMGFCVDGSKLYLVGGQWGMKDPQEDFWLPDYSKGGEFTSSSMCEADLSDPVVKFSKLHEFEAPEPFPEVMKFKERIYTLSNSVSFFRFAKLCPFPSFEVYDPTTTTHSSKSLTRLHTPPFHESC